MQQVCDKQLHDNMDPQKDIYYCDKCKNIHKCDKPLENAIYFLCVNRVKELLEKLSTEEVRNYRNKWNKNILEYTLNNLSGWSGSKFLSVDNIAYPDFVPGSVLALIGNKAEAITKYLEILELLCKKCPDLITEKMVTYASDQRATSIVKVLTNYYIERDTDNICCICFSAHNSNLIDNTCLCKNKIHLECLIELTKKHGSICKTCRGTNGAVLDPNGRMIFPFKDIYRYPLINRYLIIDDKNTKLHYAIAYLQADRVLDLLKNFTKEEYLEYYEKADGYALHNRAQGTGALTLKNMPYTNLSRDKNTARFSEIETILYDFHKKFVQVG
jgi:hypothetical protein